MKILLILFSLFFNSIMGAMFAIGWDINPYIGAGVVNGAAIVMGGVNNFLPDNVLQATIFKEVWTGYLNKAFRSGEEAIGWYKRIRSFDQYVENDVIHFINAGGAPEVLINNTTYPIAVTTINDADKPISLDKYDSTNTSVTDDILHAISYDKLASDIDLHKTSIEQKKFAKAIHALAPASNVANEAPVIATTGAVQDGRKKFTKADFLKLKRQFDILKVPQSDRILVLCSDHTNDLLEFDQQFQNQYYSYENGKITRIYGFEVYEFTDCPYYVAADGTKLPWGATVTSGHTQASIAFAASKAMRADGSIEMYWSKAENDPQYRRSVIGFRKWNICLPLQNKYIGAIYSALSA
ncbi:MAG: hypothetical protein LBH19_11240 [Dysgonamonadaceae bacterium]|jgi:hypothetical protein|nr:hypothetical protein [Dysgonamonadaceae bacterium]